MLATGQQTDSRPSVIPVTQAVEDQISHFGQAPAQLFRRRHPRRGPPPPAATQPLLNAPDAMRILSVGVPPARRSFPLPRSHEINIAESRGVYYVRTWVLLKCGSTWQASCAQRLGLQLHILRSCLAECAASCGDCASAQLQP